MDKPKRQLIFLWNYIEWGGAQIYLLSIMKKAREEFDILVVLPRKSRPDILYFLNDLGIKYEFIDTQIIFDAAPSVIDKIKRQWSRIRSEFVSFRYLMRFDLSESILHVETAPWQSLSFLIALALRRANVFVTMHNFMPTSSAWRHFIWRARLQIVSRLPGFHIFPSNQDTKDKLKGWVSNGFWEDMKVTSTAVNPKEIDAVLAGKIDIPAIKGTFGISQTEFVVLCVGQFIDRKGRWIFLDGAKKVLERNEEITFVWMTPNLPDEEDAKRIEQYALGDKFKLVLSENVGTTRQEILSFFRIANAFALPSLIEGLPIALLEAMALGLPCISTNINAIPEAIINDQTGILIEPNDSAALASAIERLIDDSEMCRILGDSGRNHVLNRFDEGVVADIAIASYQTSFSEN